MLRSHRPPGDESSDRSRDTLLFAYHLVRHTTPDQSAQVLGELVPFDCRNAFGTGARADCLWPIRFFIIYLHAHLLLTTDHDQSVRHFSRLTGLSNIYDAESDEIKLSRQRLTAVLSVPKVTVVSQTSALHSAAGRHFTSQRKRGTSVTRV